MPALTSARSSCHKQRSFSQTPPWYEHLPQAWHDRVIEPLEFTFHQEYEMAAARLFGLDEDGQRCYYRHDYQLTETRSDDDEEYYQAVVYCETVRAWRLRDGRWLIFRIVQQGEHCTPPRGFYCFSEQPPR